MKCCGAGTVISCVSWNCEFHDFLGERSFMGWKIRFATFETTEFVIVINIVAAPDPILPEQFHRINVCLQLFESAITTYGDPHHCSVLVYQFTDISNKWHDIKLWKFNSKKLKNVRLKTCGKYLDGSSWWPRLQQPGP